MTLSKITSIMQREQELRTLCAQGLSLADIGTYFGASRFTVFTACHRLGIDKLSNRGCKASKLLHQEQELRELAAKDLSYTKIAKHFGVSKTTVTTVLQKLGLYQRKMPGAWNNKWEKEKKKLLAMLRKGMSRGEIANKYGVPRAAIIGACYRLDLGDDGQVQAKQAQLKLLAQHEAGRRSVERRRRYNEKRKNKAKTTKQLPPWSFHMRAKATPTRRTLAELSLGGPMIDRCCRYPIDDVGSTFYCGAKTETETSSWCPYHAQFVFRNRTQMSGDVGGSHAAASRTGVESPCSPAKATRPHQIPQPAEAA